MLAELDDARLVGEDHRGRAGLGSSARARRQPYRCRRQIGAGIQRGRVGPEDLLFARRVHALKLNMQRFTDAGAICGSHPELSAPPALVKAVLRAVR